SLARRDDGSGYGYAKELVHDGKGRSGVLLDEFMAHSAAFLDDALDRCILGNAPFTARLNPDCAG
ncbi:hypothetical protein, partial [Campylobacter jejuni]